MEKVITDQIWPPEKSRSGKNTCYLYCKPLNRRSGYGVCLFTIQAYEEGRLNEFSACFDSIGCGNCPALAYRAEEQAAGQALYYLPRLDPVESSGGSPRQPITSPSRPDDPHYMHGWNAVERREAGKKPPKPKKTKSTVFDAEMPTLAEAVSTAAREHAVASSEHAPSACKPVHKAARTTHRSRAGSSLLERAKMMIKQREDSK